MRGQTVNGQCRQTHPSSVTFGDSFSLRAKSRLRRLRFDTRLRAQPLEGSQRRKLFLKIPPRLQYRRRGIRFSIQKDKAREVWALTNEEFTGLMQQYQKLIYTVCLQFVHEPHTAEDLTQYAEDKDLLVAKHILLLTKDMTTGEDLSDAEKAEKKAKAAVLQTVARAGGGQQMQGSPEKRLGAQGGCPGRRCPAGAARRTRQ